MIKNLECLTENYKKITVAKSTMQFVKSDIILPSTVLLKKMKLGGKAREKVTRSRFELSRTNHFRTLGDFITRHSFCLTLCE